MRKMKVYTSGLRCDAEARTLTGTALPYGEPGRTSLGKVTASKGALTLADRVVGNMEHDRTRPVALMAASEDTDKGLRMTFSVARTTAGDDLLAEVEAGLRTGLSVEVDEPVIRGGALVGGTIGQVAFVTSPAFDSARLTATAADTEDDEDEGASDEAGDEVDGGADSDADDEGEQEPTVQPNALASAHTRPRKGGVKTRAQLYGRLKAAHADGGARRMLAELADITSSDVTADVSREAWLGELWDAAPYDRRFVPLMTGGDLTSWEYKGWRWVDKPTVADYAGDKADIPSNTVSTESVSREAARIAGGHDLDRKFTDFGDTEFLDSYLLAMTESYKIVSDLHALNVLLSNATVLSPNTIPTGANAAVGAIIDAALGVLSGVRQMPNSLVIGDAIMRSLAFQEVNLPDILGQRFSLTDGQLAGITWQAGGPDFPEGQVLATVTKASRFLELPGSPIRVDALNIAQGGVDHGLFGYWGYLIDKAEGIVLVTATPTSINAGADFAMTVGAADHVVTVIATGADGATYDVTNEAVLTSGTPAKATIVNNKVHAVAAGTSVITATYGTRTDTTTVTVS